MDSLITQQLHREIETDRLRVAGYRTRVARRRNDRRAHTRAVVGNALISVGERVRGCTQSVPATSMRRA